MHQLGKGWAAFGRPFCISVSSVAPLGAFRKRDVCRFRGGGHESEA